MIVYLSGQSYSESLIWIYRFEFVNSVTKARNGWWPMRGASDSEITARVSVRVLSQLANGLIGNWKTFCERTETQQSQVVRYTKVMSKREVLSFDSNWWLKTKSANDDLWFLRFQRAASCKLALGITVEDKKFKHRTHRWWHTAH